MRPSTFRPWSAEDLQNLRLLKISGFTYGDMAEVLGRSASSVKMALVRRGCLPNAFSDTERLNHLLVQSGKDLIDGRRELDEEMENL